MDMRHGCRLYSMFKDEYRQNESIMLLLGQSTLPSISLTLIVCRSDHVVRCSGRVAVTEGCSSEGECDVQAMSQEVRLTLPGGWSELCCRFMYTLLDGQQTRAQLEYKTLLDRLATVRKMNAGESTKADESATVPSRIFF